MGGGDHKPLSVDDVFKDFIGRRNAMIKALTTDFKLFCRRCDREDDIFCLVGHPNGEWQVRQPYDYLPTQWEDVPEPVQGINCGRHRKKWLSYVAIHSDSWLLRVAFFFAGRFHFDKADRQRLFTMISSLPTIFEFLRRRAVAHSQAQARNGKENGKAKVTGS